jgi:uncharacterized repeat protein (TIGR03803 family)
MGSF